MATTVAKRSSVFLSETEVTSLQSLPIPPDGRVIIRRGNGKDYVPPAGIQEALIQAMRILAEGGEVRIMRTPEVLTSSFAAEILGVSRPTLMRWASEGDIPSFKTGTHTRFRREDVLEFKRKRDREQNEAFDRLREFEIKEFGPLG